MPFASKGIERIVGKVVAEVAGVNIGKISRYHSFEKDLPIDSLGMVEMLGIIEELFLIEIPDGKSFDNLDQIVNFISASS